MAPRAVASAIILILLYLAAVHSASLFVQMTPIDFYQYWGAAAARRLSPASLGNPYGKGSQYGAVLAEAARRSGEPRFARVSQHATPPNFTATPLAYTLFAALPANYPQASLLYYALQALFFLVATVLLGLVYRYPLFPLLCLALLLFLASAALNADLRLGNLGCLQFLSLAICLALADRLRQGQPSVALGGIVLSGLTLLALVKPNLVAVAFLMALHFWVAYGTRFFAVATLAAALAGGVAVILSCLYFASWTVWPEWYGVVAGPSPRAVGRPTAAYAHYIGGNYSTPLLLGYWLQLSWRTSTGLVAAGLAASMVAAVGWAVMSNARDRVSPIRAALARMLGDPHLTAAIGVTLTIALPPLVWYHYYIIALAPALWLLNARSGSSPLRLWGLAALVLTAGLPAAFLILLGWSVAAHVSGALSWVALWCGVLLQLSQREAAMDSEGEQRRERQPAPGGGSGRRRSRAGTPSRR